MIIPIRCFTCGKVIGNKWNRFLQLVENRKEMSKIFQDLGLNRYCCRRMIISNVDLITKLLQYNSKANIFLFYIFYFYSLFK